MYSTEQGYVYETFQDGRVLWKKESYEKHCRQRYALIGEEARNAIQDALVSPDYISKYPLLKSNGRLKAWCWKYRRFTHVPTKERKKYEY